MFVIGDILVSLDIVERFFSCDLDACKGQCCIDGDAGAPLLEEEKYEIEKNINKILPLLTPGGRKAVEEYGSSYIDEEGDLVTTLVEGSNCAYCTFSESGVCLCALEKGYREGLLPQLKPSSCHLYPVRLTQTGTFTAVNFHKWKICRSAEKKGKELNIRAYQFLKEPLTRQFGEEWYAELEKTAKEWLSQNNSKNGRNQAE